jgi:predicted  nucleic acid-binding Zn-ribbon protein
MTQNLRAELERLDQQIAQKTEALKRLKKARRQINKALDQLDLPFPDTKE